MNWRSILIWVAIVLLLDAAFGLWNHDRFRQLAPKINIFRIALLEAFAALVLLAVRFLF
jgi:hypothetical protein